MIFFEIDPPAVKPFFFRSETMIRFGFLWFACGWSRRSLHDYHEAAASGKTEWLLTSRK